MNFSIDTAIEILELTPKVLTLMLGDISEEWTLSNEGENTWSPYDIIGHLIHGEKTDWIPRTKIILSNESGKDFETFDRFAQFEASKGKSMSQLLEEFSELRAQNIEALLSEEITEDKLLKTGIHPTFGDITLKQLLSTWAAHDLNHIAQVSRVMAKQLKSETGPWVQFLKILND